MKKKTYLTLGFLTCATLCMASTMSHAGTPLFTFTPLTPTKITVPSNLSNTISYKVTNNSHLSNGLVMQSIAGITQNTTTAGNCANSFILGYQQSCNLELKVDGKQLKGNLRGGPVVCRLDNPLQCYQPSRENSIDVTLGGITKPCHVFEWFNFRRTASAGSFNLEAIIYESGTIVYQYAPGSNTGLGLSSTEGIQQANPFPPGTGVTLACNILNSVPASSVMCLVPKASSPFYDGYNATTAPAQCGGYDFIDIQTTGTFITSGIDQAGTVNMPSPLNLYGTNYTKLRMSTSGYLATNLLDSGADFTNDCPLPQSITPNGTRVYPMHDDLRSNPGGGGYYQYFTSCPREL